jgi:hypothetical protein
MSRETTRRCSVLLKLALLWMGSSAFAAEPAPNRDEILAQIAVVKKQLAALEAKLAPEPIKAPPKKYRYEVCDTSRCPDCGGKQLEWLTTTPRGGRPYCFHCLNPRCTRPNGCLDDMWHKLAESEEPIDAVEDAATTNALPSRRYSRKYMEIPAGRPWREPEFNANGDYISPIMSEPPQ